jgi:HAE1 family hydrophobic/amphiphilic exporter-1
MSVRDAVVEGGRRRLRPILMTAIATIFALLPMALGLTGEGGFISQPLAVVVIGGLLSSTLLTLVLVPTLYTMVERTKETGRDRRARRRAAKAAPPEGAGTAGAKPTGYHPAHAANDRAAADQAAGATTTGKGNGSAPVATALREPTDQFEILRLPKAPKKPEPPASPPALPPASPPKEDPAT